ncbi:MAG TPA: hypothetical protein VLB04_07000 [Methanotrichaceae archaeon]|nr:hypothetical protein [Methanotrichaceae archaeon]
MEKFGSAKADLTLPIAHIFTYIHPDFCTLLQLKGREGAYDFLPNARRPPVHPDFTDLMGRAGPQRRDIG